MSAAHGQLQASLARLAADRLPIIAGGTDVYPALGDAAPPAVALDVSGLAALRGIDIGATGVRIGAAASWQSIAEAPLPPALRALQAAAREIGSVQIQSRGTLGGNLCTASPAADSVPALLILDAGVTLASVAGQRTMPLGDFVLGPRRTACQPDELLVSIDVPASAPGTVSRFSKLGGRRYLVISIAMLAMSLRADAQGRACGTAIAVGACSPVAQRLPLLEARLDGVSLSDGAALQAAVSAALADGALEPLRPIDDVRASAAYRLEAVGIAVQRLALATAAAALEQSAVEATS